MAINLNFGNYLLLNIAFLIKPQEYLCKNPATNVFEPCSREYICEN